MDNWVYVDQQLPKYEEKVLLAVRNIYNYQDDLVIIGYRKSTDSSGEHYVRESFEGGWDFKFKVIKWQPLPKF